MTTEAAQKFADLIRDDSCEKPQIESAMRELLSSASGSKTQANDVLRTLSGLIGIKNRVRGGFVSVVCGSLVEQGCDPQIIAAPITNSLREIMPACKELLIATQAEMREIDEDDEETDPDEVFEQTLEQVQQRMPDQAHDWKALEAFWRAAVVAYSLVPSERARAADLRPLADDLCGYHEAGHWLGKLLAVLDNEPMIAIDPAKRLGIVGRMSGISENFQLNALLMDVFPNPGLLRRRRISKRAAALVRGDGPQVSDETLTAPWNLYTYQAIAGGKSLPEESGSGVSVHWIWNEGIPDDIPVAFDKRVILIGPMSYPRMFQCQRMFAKLPASIEIDETLTPEQVDTWIEKLRGCEAENLI